MKEKHIGTTLDSWLEEQGIRQEVTNKAAERVVARLGEARRTNKETRIDTPAYRVSR